VLSDQPFEKGPDIILPSGKNRYLSDNDIRRLQWGINQVRKIVSSPPLSQLIRNEVSPSNLNDEAMNVWINDNVYPSSHWTGTASLGKVVDESLKVKRVEGLRIADASVIPIITNGPIHATVVAIASLCADIIQGKRTMNP
jgi:choline dehydrogenase